MNVGVRHSAVLIGASKALDDLRRSLQLHGCSCVSAVGSLRGVRSLLIEEIVEPTTVIVTLDQSTHERFGVELSRLIESVHSASNLVRCVGLLTDPRSLPWAAQMGCDWYVHDATDAAWIVGMMLDPVHASSFRDAFDVDTQMLDRHRLRDRWENAKSIDTRQTLNRLAAIETAMEELFRDHRSNC